jgi:DNA-directed RNA polymerase specialized sigma24 family protein
MIYKGVNGCWNRYSANPSDQSLENLLDAVRKQVTVRLSRVDRDFDDIAQKVVILVWEALSAGQFDPERGDMATYVTTVARTARMMHHRSDRLMLVEEGYLEKLQYNHQLKEKVAQDPIEYEQAVEK